MQPDTCVTVSVCPATVMVPMRCGPVFATMLKFTVPLPVPELPDVICRNDGALLVAVQGQAAFVMTWVALDPFPLPIVSDVGLIEYTQPDA